MNKPYLIGLNGKARSGKDTSADFIQEWCEDNNFTSARESFARRLKESAAHALGIFENEVEFCNKFKGDYERGFVEVRMATKGGGPNAVISRISGREFLQYYGTEAHRDIFGEDFWVDTVLPVPKGDEGLQVPQWQLNFRWKSSAGTEGGIADVCLITDCRFPNEAQRIKELGGQVWKVIRDGSGAGTHASEQELPGELIDLVIDNNGSFSDLQEAVGVAMSDLSELEVAV